jgi:hypothetical protein
VTILLYAIAAMALFLFFTLGIVAWQGAAAIRRFRRQYGREGKDLLLVYSNSPHWQQYVESEWLPRWRERAVVVNWSERSRWSGREPEIVLFRSIAGSREYNPIAIVVPPKGPVRVVRFWRAFRDKKHGKDSPLENAERELQSALDGLDSA